MQTYLQPGRVLVGKYRVERVLGEGAMGVVLLAHHMHLDERVAIKVPLPEALVSPDAVSRFLREARAAVKIKSEHVARVSDVGTLDTGEPYIVMEYLAGRDLAAWLEGNGAMAIEQAVEFVLQACEALAEAHSLGIVHRDLKPANLFCTLRADGILSVKVLDFGISKVGAAGNAAEASMTKAGTVMGSPLYMSPEQLVSSRDVDVRSDIWAIGVILFELLAGVPPFIGETLIGISMQIAQAPPRPLRGFRPDIPAALEAVILRCLEKDRNRRFSNVAEMAKALFPFAPKRSRGSVERIVGVIASSSRSGSAGFAETALPASSDPSPSTDALGGPAQTAGAFRQTAPPGRRAGPLVGLGVAVLGLGFGAFTWLGSGSEEPVAEPSKGSASSMPASDAPAPPVQQPAKAPAPEETPRAIVTPEAKGPDVSPVTVKAEEPTPPPPAVEKAPARRATSARPRPSPKKETTRKESSRKEPDAPASSGKKTSCTPNYYFDAQGEKHFKPECF